MRPWRRCSIPAGDAPRGIPLGDGRSAIRPPASRSWPGSRSLYRASSPPAGRTAPDRRAPPGAPACRCAPARHVLQPPSRIEAAFIVRHAQRTSVPHPRRISSSSSKAERDLFTIRAKAQVAPAHLRAEFNRWRPRSGAPLCLCFRGLVGCPGIHRDIRQHLALGDQPKMHLVACRHRARLTAYLQGSVSGADDQLHVRMISRAPRASLPRK